MMKFVIDRLEDIVVKGENDGNQNFLSHPLMFLKGFFCEGCENFVFVKD